jgi:hypothetical protein
MAKTVKTKAQKPTPVVASTKTLKGGSTGAAPVNVGRGANLGTYLHPAKKK